VYGGKVASFDPAEALKIPGVERVVQIEDTPPPAVVNPLGGVAVIGSPTPGLPYKSQALRSPGRRPNAGYDR